MAKRMRFYASRVGMTQQEIAQFLGVTEQAVSQWFRGKTTPTLENLAKLCRICGITLEQFFADLPDNARAAA